MEPVPDDARAELHGRALQSRPAAAPRGEYWVNTYALRDAPALRAAALTLHEAVPGHHTAGRARARARGRAGVPPQLLSRTRSAKAGALYSEKPRRSRWASTTRPTSASAALTYEMWRACRLVVDTGMHAMGWTRQQAIDYMTENTALSEHEIRTEVDRYIAWPGQALAYKTGELEIKALRRRAEAALGPRFDIRAFHDAVLGQGGVTLPVLEQQIDAYIARARGP